MTYLLCITGSLVAIMFNRWRFKNNGFRYEPNAVDIRTAKSLIAYYQRNNELEKADIYIESARKDLLELDSDFGDSCLSHSKEWFRYVPFLNIFY